MTTDELLSKIPEDQRQAAAVLVGQYGPPLFGMAIEQAWEYLRRLMAGDIQVVADLDAQLSTDEWLAKVKANTARWENVAQYNAVRDKMRNEVLLRLAPILLSVLMALVGL